MSGHLTFMYETLNKTTLNQSSSLDQAGPHQALHRQTVMREQKTEHSLTEGKWHNLLFWNFVHDKIF